MRAFPPRLTAADLTWLFLNLDDPEVRLQIARHPHVPEHLVVRLLIEFPRDLCANPALPPLLSGAPMLLRWMNPTDALPVLREEALHPTVVRQLQGSAFPAVAEAARLHICVAGEATGNWPRWLADHLRSLEPGDSGTLLRFYETGQLPYWIGWQLAGDANGEIRARVLRRPELAALRETLVRASGSDDLRRTGPAPEGDIAPADLSHFTAGPIWFRHLAARHPATAPGALAGLVQDADGFVRVRAARNPSLPRWALELVVRSDDEVLRIAAARNPALTDEMIALLAGDPSPRVRTALRHRGERVPPSNQTTPPESRTSPATPSTRSRITLADVLDLAATRDAAALESACEDRQWLRRLAAAANPHVQAIDLLAHDGNRWVRAVARWRQENPGRTFRLFS